MGRADDRDGRRDREPLLLRRVSRRPDARAAVGRLHDEPHPRARAADGRDPPRAADRGAASYCGRGRARLLQPARSDDLRARGRSRRSTQREGHPHPRVRPPHRGEPRESAVRERGLRHEALGLVRERLLADAGGRPLPRRRGLAPLHAQPRRGVRRDVPRAERAEARPPAGVVDDREHGARTRRDGPLAARAGRDDAVDGLHREDAHGEADGEGPHEDVRRVDALRRDGRASSRGRRRARR